MGDAIRARSREIDAIEKIGKMGGGRTIIGYSQVVYVNQKDEIVQEGMSDMLIMRRPT